MYAIDVHIITHGEPQWMLDRCLKSLEGQPVHDSGTVDGSLLECSFSADILESGVTYEWQVKHRDLA